MIYCVVPEAMGEDLYDKMVEYYADDPGVTVIRDRRTEGERRGPGKSPNSMSGKRELRDRRRRRPGDFPPLTIGE